MRVLLAAAVVAGLSAAWQQEIFRVSVDAVRVDVLVTDGRRAVAGLTAADFELRDAGVVQRIDAVSFEDVPLRLMLALDASASVRGEPLEDLKQAASAVIRLLGPGDRAALLTFSEEVDVRSEWTADGRQLERAIAGTEASGSTAMHDAAYAALTLQDPEPGRRLVLMFSDGDDTASWLPGQTVLDVARRGDAVIYAVGRGAGGVRKAGYLLDFRSGLQADLPRVVPSALTKPFLAALAEDTGGQYIDAGGSDRLREAFTRILAEFRSRYLLTYTPAGVGTGGWHPIEVKIRNKKGNVVARRGYLR